MTDFSHTAERWSEEERNSLYVLCQQNAKVHADGSVYVCWPTVCEKMEAAGFSRSLPALKAHFKHDHPEGASSTTPHTHYTHREDVALLKLISDHTAMSATHKPHVQWDKVEQGMMGLGYNHSLLGLKAHAHKLNE